MLKDSLGRFFRNSALEPIFSTAGVGAINRVLTLGTRLIAVPFAINYLGAEKFGLVMTLASGSGYALLLDLGLSSALVNSITGAHALDDMASANRHITVGLFFLTSLAVLASLVCVGVIPLFDWITVFKLHATSQSEVVAALIVCAFLFLFQLPLSLVLKVPYTFQRGALSEVFLLVAAILNLAGLVVSLEFGMPLWVIAFFMIGSQFVAAVALFAYLLAKRTIRLTWESWESFSSTLGSLRQSGLHFFLMQVVSVLLSALQFTLLAVFKGASEVAIYALLYQIMMAVIGPFMSLVQPMWTRVAHFHRLGKISEIRGLLRVHLRASLAYSTLAVVFFLLFLNPVVRPFLAKPQVFPLDLRIGFAVLTVLGLVFGGGMGSIVLGMNLSRQMALFSILQFMVFLFSVFYLVPRAGALGMVTSICIANAFSIPGLIWLLQSRLNPRKSEVAV